jgi:hypothetical protein
MRQSLNFIAVLVACAAMSGCGDASHPANGSSHRAVERGIFISASDCAATGKLTLEQCGRAIDAAVVRHEAHAPAYNSRHQCEANAGVDRCDRGVDGRYRLRLQAFFVTLANPANAVALYPPSKVMIGFQSPSKQPVDARDDTLRVSDAALSLAHENAKLPTAKSRSSAGLGSAAADIH